MLRVFVVFVFEFLDFCLPEILILVSKLLILSEALIDPEQGSFIFIFRDAHAQTFDLHLS